MDIRLLVITVLAIAICLLEIRRSILGIINRKFTIAYRGLSEEKSGFNAIFFATLYLIVFIVVLLGTIYFLYKEYFL